MVIAIANQKGGVGKTTLSITFSNYLAELKKEILVVDFDFQSSFYGLWEDEKNIYDNPPPYDVIKQELSNSKNVVSMLKGIDDGTVILDLPGKLDDDNLIPIFNVTDAVLVPFSYDKLCFESTLFFVQLVKHINKDIRLVFVPNRIKSGVKYKTKEQVDKILSDFGNIISIIPDKICLQRLSSYSNNKKVQDVVNEPFEAILKLL